MSFRSSPQSLSTSSRASPVSALTPFSRYFPNLVIAVPIMYTSSDICSYPLFSTEIFQLSLCVELIEEPDLPQRGHAKQRLDLLGVSEPLLLAVVLHVTIAAQDLYAVGGHLAGCFLDMEGC